MGRDTEDRPPVVARRQQTRDALAARGAFGVAAELPVAAAVDELAAAIRDHQVVIVAGETGSGKSTQLPKLCLALGYGVERMIGHTQPRRVAARTIAERIATETGTELGTTVGYTVRFNDRVSDQTMVRVMTDGILLAEIQRDRMLRRYELLIVDEAHERSLNVDFLLGYLTRLLRQRPDLKLIVTSATIDTERFAAHFAEHGIDAPIVTVGGRMYPVEVRYRPYGTEPDDDRDQVAAITDAVRELQAEGPGDILVFLSGEREIHDTADALRRLQLPHTDVLPLYARLSAVEQHRIFEPHTGRRVVLSTNVAETSITVPGVRYVVDAGTARISRYSLRLKVQRLPIERVSQASTNQRAGRCGRLGPGICIRLYDADDWASRPAHTEPEILRTNLASVILQMAGARLGDVADFPFIEPPDRRAIRDGYAVLDELGALAPGELGQLRRLTRIGRDLARLPVDPRLGRMVIEAARHGCVREVLVIAAAMSIPDPRERPAEHRQAADALHRRFATDGSDVMALVRLWDHLRAEQQQRSSNQFRKLCRTEYLNYLRVREWQDLFSQLRQAAGEVGIRQTSDATHPDLVHRSVLAGLLSHLGQRDAETREYRGAFGSRFVVAPGSALGTQQPRWLMAGQLVETDRLRARLCAPVRPEWAEALAGPLAKRSYGEPRWEPGRGAAVATERVSLFGLPIVAGRAVGLDRLDPGLAQQMFIRHALVQGEADEAWLARQRFRAANLRFLGEIEARAERTRQVAVFDDGSVEAFYAARLPADVTSVRHFDRWWKRARAEQPDLLTMTAADLQAGGAGLDDEFPTRWRQGDLEFQVTYRFEPGAPDDGATVHIPIDVLNRVDEAPFSWSVPGVRPALVDHLVRALPKDARRELQPMAEAVEAVVADLRRQTPHGPLAEAVATALRSQRGVRVEPHEVDASGAPAHLRLGFAVDDERGRTLASGKDLGMLRRTVGVVARQALADAAPIRERAGLTAWPDEPLPDCVETPRAGRVVRSYPALVDDGDSVSVRVLSTPDLQRRVMHGGVRRLLLIAAGVSATAIERQLTNRQRLDLVGGGADLSALVADCATAVADDALDEWVTVHGMPTDADTFRRMVAAVKPRLAADTLATVRQVATLLTHRSAIERRLDQLSAPAAAPVVDDVRAQLTRLLRPGFVAAGGRSRLADVERYLRAAEHRLARLGEGLARDLAATRQIRELEQRYVRLLDPYARRAVPPRLVQLGWQLEELRVATFAPPVGAAKGTSVTRIARAMADAEADARRDAAR